MNEKKKERKESSKETTTTKKKQANAQPKSIIFERCQKKTECDEDARIWNERKGL